MLIKMRTSGVFDTKNSQTTNVHEFSMDRVT